jgi:hypothetical protein
VDDPSDRAVADEVVRRLGAEFGPKHELIQQDNARIQEQITALSKRFTQIEARLDEIEHKTGFNIELARAAAAANAARTQEPPVPGAETPRPAAIDRACVAGVPATVLVPEFGLELQPEPGSDPEAVWPAAVRAINGEGSGDGGLRGSRRARRN